VYPKQGDNGILFKRNKNINWIHSVFSKRTGKSFTLRQCFFGEHLLASNNKMPVAVVSEKTAVICSLLLPEYIWLATGGVSGCGWKGDKIVSSVLLGREVVFFPDLGFYERWCSYTEELKKLLPVNIVVSNLVEIVATDVERNNNSGFDLADYLLKQKHTIPP
jgi:hypothetical protein